MFIIWIPKAMVSRTPRLPSAQPCVCVLDTIKEGGVYHMEFQSKGFPDAQNPGAQPNVCDGHHKGKGVFII